MKEHYLNFFFGKKRRKLITKLRIDYYSLMIEKKRYIKIPREKGQCSQCKKSLKIPKGV